MIPSDFIVDAALTGAETLFPPLSAALRLTKTRKQVVQTAAEFLDLASDFIFGGSQVSKSGGPRKRDRDFVDLTGIWAIDADHESALSDMARSRGFRRSKTTSRRRKPASRGGSVTKRTVKRMIMDQTLKQDLVSFVEDKSLTPIARNSNTTVQAIRILLAENKAEIAIGSQDVAAGDRSGNSIILKSAQLNFRIDKNGAAPQSQTVRIIAGYWFGDGTPNLRDIFTSKTTDGTTVIVNWDTATYRSATDSDATHLASAAFKILFDRRVIVSTGLAETAHRDVILAVKGHVVRYHNEASTDESSGALWLFVIWDGTANAPLVHMTSKIKYSS